VKKRLRKKTHIGEFKEWGVIISITKSTDVDFDVFVDEFIEHNIKENACYFTGTSKENTLEGFIDLGCSLEKAKDKLAKITAWLNEKSDVKNHTVGKLTDAWHGPFDQREEPEATT
tara:strand:+ start:1325 stop:1672 length:348 start_codon:yes stop_codon:yes gene_type:complete